MESAVLVREAEPRRRWFALIQFLGFVALIALLAVLTGFGASTAVHFFYGKKLDPAIAALVGTPILAIAALVATFVMARLTRQPFLRFGLGGRHGLRNLLLGIASGIALLAILLQAMQAMGGLSFGPVAEDGAALLRWGSIYGTLFVVVALSEELIFRGFALVSLSRAVSFWPAAVILSLLFGGLHLGNGGEDIAGALAAALFGLVMAITFKWTGSLWLAIGVHAGWDYAESFIFGVPDSGQTLAGRAMHPSFHGPLWLTGGSVGPEGSALVVFPLLTIVVIGWLLRERGA
jgi:hypothetical protein